MAGVANMAEEKQSGGGNSLIVLVAAAVSAAYFAWQKPQLEGFRPAETLHQAHDYRGVQDVEARLWQDPLVTVNDQYEGEKKDGPATDEHHSIKNAEDILADSLVIGVTLPGGPYHEDGEARRRLRYAVLAALHTANYVPKDERHLGYFVTGQNEPRDGANRPEAAAFHAAAHPFAPGDKRKITELSLPILIPFEKFESQKGDGAAQSTVSILWLNEDVMAAAGKPIESIQELLCQLNLQKSKGFAIVGPQDSTTLIDMLKEVKGPSHNEGDWFLDKCDKSVELKISILPMYNFGATANEDILLRRAGFGEHKSRPHTNIVEELLRSEHIYYYRTVYTDQALASTLVKELQFRNVRKNSDHVALIFESDTVYGRSLRDTMAREFALDASQSPRIDSFSYLRGLDGQLPERAIAKKKSSGEDSGATGSDRQPNDAAKGSASQNEVADGQGQFDYLLRLADHLHQLDDELRHDGESKIAAVGILGSDVYDKHLLLEALKPELPQAVFFTTDLDALLLPHGKFRFTRNLIVASSYGLELSDSLQPDIPSFRTAYQTSIFLATRLALRNELAADPGTDSRQKTRDALERWLPQADPRVKVFQIGRSHIQSLNSSENLGYGARGGDILDYPSIDPTGAATRFFPEIKSGSVIPTGLLAAILLGAALMTSGRLRKFCFPRDELPDSRCPTVRPRLGWLVILLGAVVLVGLGLSASWSFVADGLTDYGIGEPMSLPEGISVWPTIFLRALSCGLGVLLIFYTLRSLETDLNRRRKEMYLPEPCFQLWKGQSLVARWCEMASLLWFRPDADIQQRKNDTTKHQNSGPTLNDQISDSGIKSEKIQPKRPFNILWMTYCYYGLRGWRLVRATMGSLAMMALWLLLANIFGEPNAPARGPVAYHVYSWITILDVAITLLLIFLVVDATLFSRSVVLHLTAVESHWPGKLVEGYKERFRLGRANLED
jgi:hypothetical protein